MTDSSTISKRQKCVEALKQARDELGHSPSRPEYDEMEILPDSATIEREFGTWNKAKRAAGMAVTEKATANWSEQACINALQTACDELGHPPSVSEYRRLDLYPRPVTIRRTLGGWNDAKREAGLPVNEASTQRYTELECVEAVLSIAEDIDHPPTITEYRSDDSGPSVKTITKHFDGWGEVKSIVESRLEESRQKSES